MCVYGWVCVCLYLFCIDFLVCRIGAKLTFVRSIRRQILSRDFAFFHLDALKAGFFQAGLQIGRVGDFHAFVLRIPDHEKHHAARAQQSFALQNDFRHVGKIPG